MEYLAEVGNAYYDCLLFDQRLYPGHVDLELHQRKKELGRHVALSAGHDSACPQASEN
jgi:hypothetical protein